MQFSRPSEQFGYSYIGRYGELRSVDYFGQDFSIRLDGVSSGQNDTVSVENRSIIAPAGATKTATASGRPWLKISTAYYYNSVLRNSRR